MSNARGGEAEPEPESQQSGLNAKKAYERFLHATNRRKKII